MSNFLWVVFEGAWTKNGFPEIDTAILNKRTQVLKQIVWVFVAFRNSKSSRISGRRKMGDASETKMVGLPKLFVTNKFKTTA